MRPPITLKGGIAHQDARILKLLGFVTLTNRRTASDCQTDVICHAMDRGRSALSETGDVDTRVFLWPALGDVHTAVLLVLKVCRQVAVRKRF